MAATDTLLAYMIPSMTNQVEVAATKALAYILTKYDVALEAFNDLVSTTIDQKVAPVKWVDVEVSYVSASKEPGGSEEVGRLDLVGYDELGEKRVIVEAKFGASIGKGQGSGYFCQLPEKDTSVLMFLVPNYRIDYLWVEAIRDLRAGTEVETLNEVKTGAGDRIKCSKVITKDPTPDRYLMIVSWRELLAKIKQKTGDDADFQSDVHQLIGVTERMDIEETHPFEQDELGPDFGRRMRDLRLIYDGVVAQLRRKGWASIENLSVSGQPETGYGRYFRFSGKDVWFGIYYDLWIDEAFADTPFWLNPYGCDPAQLGKIRKQTALPQPNNTRLRDRRGEYFPLSLRPDVGIEGVVEHMVSQIEKIADAIKDTNQPA